MGDGATQDPSQRSGPFEALDATLSVFALANGLDLVRGPSARRLEWYRDGRDRGILLESRPDGGVAACALAWNQEEPGVPPRSTRLDPLPPDLSARALTAALEEGIRAANAL